MFKSRIIHLFGSKKNIEYASIEIKSFIFEKGFGVKVIENNNIINELNKNINRDVYINKIDELDYDKIYKLHNIININYNHLSFPFLIKSNKENTNRKNINHVYNINHIYNIYNIDDKIIKKNMIINNILYNYY